MPILFFLVQGLKAQRQVLLLMEVAAVLKGLVALSRTKPLSFREKKMLERAKYLLVSELATVRNTTEQTVETNIVRALAKAKLQMPEATALPD